MDTNRKKHRAKEQRRNKLIRAQLVQLAGGTCMDCGLRYPPVCLDFHHRDGTTKSFGLNIVNMYREFAVLMEEIDKCDLVCANCHRIRHA